LFLNRNPDVPLVNLVLRCQALNAVFKQLGILVVSRHKGCIVSKELQAWNTQFVYQRLSGRFITTDLVDFSQTRSASFPGAIKSKLLGVISWFSALQ